MDKHWREILAKNRAIAVIRSPNLTQGLKMAEAMAAGGLEIIEITWNSHHPQQLITQLCQELPHCTIGTGTLLTLADLQAALDTGVQFCFTPHTAPLLIQTAIKANIPIIPGALTPTEIVTAWQMGASCVKVFPVASLGGVEYIKNLQAPLAPIPLIPTGGVTLDNAPDFIRAGAIAVGLSSQLFPPSLLEAQAWKQISAQAQQLKSNLALLGR